MFKKIVLFFGAVAISGVTVASAMATPNHNDMDLNHDTKVTRAEFESYFSQKAHSDHMFLESDKNTDGAVTPTEWEAYTAKKNHGDESTHSKHSLNELHVMNMQNGEHSNGKMPEHDLDRTSGHNMVGGQHM